MDGLEYNPHFIPKRVSGVINLVDSLYSDDRLTPKQLAACRKILHLDDPRPVWQRITEGERP